MIFIALVAVAVWLADLRLAIALPLVGLAWLIAATIEWLGWRSAHAPVPVTETGPMSPPLPPHAADEALAPEPDSVPAPDPAPLPVAEEPVEPPPTEPEHAAAVEPEPEPTERPEPEPTVAEPESVVSAELQAPTDADTDPDLEPAQPTPAPADATLIVAAERSPRWARRRRLRAVPAPSAEEAPAPPATPLPRTPETQVVSFPQRTHVPRRWNIWDLERLARAEATAHPERRDEWAFLFVHLRQFANADGELPADFDSLVRESFGSLLDRQPIR